MTSTAGKGASLGTKAVLAAICALALCASALAQGLPRNIPENAERAVIRHVQDMIVALDNTPVRLAPGAQIRDPNNFIIVPSALPQQGALAEYTLGADGQILRVWLLTPEEAARNRRPRWFWQ